MDFLNEIESLKARITARDGVLMELAHDLSKIKEIAAGVVEVEPHITALVSKLFAAIASVDVGNYAGAVVGSVAVLQEIEATYGSIAEQVDHDVDAVSADHHEG